MLARLFVLSLLLTSLSSEVEAQAWYRDAVGSANTCREKARAKTRACMVDGGSFEYCDKQSGEDDCAEACERKIADMATNLSRDLRADELACISAGSRYQDIGQSCPSAEAWRQSEGGLLVRRAQL